MSDRGCCDKDAPQTSNKTKPKKSLRILRYYRPSGELQENGVLGNFELPEHAFGADDTFEAAARQLIQWRHSVGSSAHLVILLICCEGR